MSHGDTAADGPWSELERQLRRDARERRLRANGLQHHLIEWGPEDSQRPLVLLCHGFLDMAWGWALLAPLLAARGYRVAAFDWRGHGESDWIGPGGYYHFPDYLLDLAELGPQLSESAIHLVGHSMGSSACAMYAAANPGPLRSLALLEGLGPPAMDTKLPGERLQSWIGAVQRVRAQPRPRLDSVQAASARLRKRNPGMDEAFACFLARNSTCPHPDGQGLCWRFDPLHRTPSAYGFDLQRFQHTLSAITTPTLVVLGEKGLRTGDEDTRAGWLGAIRSRVTLPGADHMLQWSRPDALASQLLDFWERTT